MKKYLFISLLISVAILFGACSKETPPEIKALDYRFYSNVDNKEFVTGRDFYLDSDNKEYLEKFGAIVDKITEQGPNRDDAFDIPEYNDIFETPLINHNKNIIVMSWTKDENIKDLESNKRGSYEANQLTLDNTTVIDFNSLVFDTENLKDDKSNKLFFLYKPNLFDPDVYTVDKDDQVVADLIEFLKENASTIGDKL